MEWISSLRLGEIKDLCEIKLYTLILFIYIFILKISFHFGILYTVEGRGKCMLTRCKLGGGCKIL